MKITITLSPYIIAFAVLSFPTNLAAQNDDNFVIGMYLGSGHNTTGNTGDNNTYYTKDGKWSNSFYPSSDGTSRLDDNGNATSVLNVLSSDGFNTLFLYFPSFDTNGRWEGLRRWSLLAGNNEMKIAFDEKYFFTPDFPTGHNPNIHYNGALTGKNIFSFSGNPRFRMNFAEMCNQVFSDTTYSKHIYGHQLAEEPASIHSYCYNDNGPGETHPSSDDSDPSKSMLGCSVPPKFISDAIDSVNHYQQNFTVKPKTIVALAKHAGGIGDSAMFERTYDYLDYSHKGLGKVDIINAFTPQMYLDLNHPDVNSLPDVFLDAAYYKMWPLDVSLPYDKYEDILSPVKYGHHYLGRFLTIDWAKTKLNTVISGINVTPWYANFSQPITKGHLNVDNYYGTNGANSEQFNIHHDTNTRNCNGVWFQAYTSIIHGAHGVMLWDFNSWAPTNVERQNHNDLCKYSNHFDRQYFPSVYQSYIGYLAKELRWLSNNNLIGKNTDIIYKKTDHLDKHCIVPPADTYTDEYHPEENEFQSENYGIRYTINTNGEDVIMILSNPLMAVVEVPLSFDHIGNQIIQNSLGVEVLFKLPGDPSDPDYKVYRDGSVNLDLNLVSTFEYHAFGSTKQVLLKFGPLDVHVLRFRKNNNPNTQIDHWLKVFSNNGDGWIGNSKVQSADTLIIGDYNNDGEEELLNISPGNGWGMMLKFNNTTNEWDELWRSPAGFPHALKAYDQHFVVGKFIAGDNADYLLGYDTNTGQKELFGFTTALGWQSIWLSHPSDHITTYFESVIAGDFDGDGQSEVLCYDQSGWTTEFKYNGTKFAWGSWSDYGSHKMRDYRNNRLTVGDFDNDGRDELMGFGPSVILFDYLGGQWSEVWEDPANIGGWLWPFVTDDKILTGNIDNYDSKDELIFIQRGQNAYWATSFNFFWNTSTTPPTNDWDWNWSANPTPNNQAKIFDWSIPDENGSNTDYYLIKVNQSDPQKLLALRQYGCYSWELSYLINMYETQQPFDYLVAQDQNVLPTSQITVHPNPTNDILIISSGLDHLTSLKLSSTTGKTMYEKKLNSVHSSFQLSLSALDFVSGIYYLHVQTEKGTQIFKVQMFSK